MEVIRRYYILGGAWMIFTLGVVIALIIAALTGHDTDHLTGTDALNIVFWPAMVTGWIGQMFV